MTLGVWDTAGSERYEAMSRMYYRNAKVLLTKAAFRDILFFLNIFFSDFLISFLLLFYLLPFFPFFLSLNSFFFYDCILNVMNLLF